MVSPILLLLLFVSPFFLLSVFGRAASSWESSVSGPEAAAVENERTGAWLQAAELLLQRV